MIDIAIVPHEALARVVTFSIILALLIAWESRAALRERRISLARRWFTNLGMGVIDTLILRILFPAGAVGIAMLASRQQAGLFNFIALPAYAEVAASILLLDLTIYIQHWLFHAVPWLWRVHRVHHADPEVDASTALRFHPVEILLSMLLKAVVVFAFGMPALAVLMFEILLNGAAMFNHANASLPRQLEPWARAVLVTPDMHRIHHSTDRGESGRNFGFSFSWWDRMFGTYCPASRTPRERMPIGLPDGPAEPQHLRLGSLLLLPFRGRSARMQFNR